MPLSPGHHDSFVVLSGESRGLSQIATGAAFSSDLPVDGARGRRIDLSVASIPLLDLGYPRGLVEVIDE